LECLNEYGKNIVRLRFFDENCLMNLATLGALAIHKLPEAVAVMLFLKIGGLFQDLAVSCSRKSIKFL
jgi:Cd2+/Zn2+-exporting ATPase